MITDAKRAELRAKRAERREELRRIKNARKARAWTGPERTGWNSLVPGGRVVAQACAETRRKYKIAHPVPRPADRPPREKPEEPGSPTNGIVGPVECNSAYERGEGLCSVGHRAPRPQQRMSYTTAVLHGIVREN